MDISLRNDVLDKATQTVQAYLNDHPTIYKVALIVNHIFRAVAMRFFMLALPFSAPVSLALCFGASLFYRLTVEGNCAYKFALPAFFGAVSYTNAFALASYFVYVVLTVNYDVDHPCCRK